MVAEEFEGVAALDQRQPQRDQPLEFDRANFRAVLFRLRTALRGFIVIQFATDAFRFAVEEIDEGPQEVGEIGFETGVEKEARQSLDDRLERKRCGVTGGQGTRIRLFVEGSIAMQSEFIEKVRGRRLGFMVWTECIDGQEETSSFMALLFRSRPRRSRPDSDLEPRADRAAPEGSKRSEERFPANCLCARNARSVSVGQGKEVGGERCGKRAACGDIAALSGRRAALSKSQRRGVLKSLPPRANRPRRRVGRRARNLSTTALRQASHCGLKARSPRPEPFLR